MKSLSKRQLLSAACVITVEYIQTLTQLVRKRGRLNRKHGKVKDEMAHFVKMENASTKDTSTENVSTSTYLSAEMTTELSTVTEFKF